MNDICLFYSYLKKWFIVILMFIDVVFFFIIYCIYKRVVFLNFGIFLIEFYVGKIKIIVFY